MQPPLYPPALADTRDGAGLARGAVLRVYAGTQNEIRKYENITESAKRKGENKEPLERSGKLYKEAISKWER